MNWTSLNILSGPGTGKNPLKKHGDRGVKDLIKAFFGIAPGSKT
jgi:hypothetical protein